MLWHIDAPKETPGHANKADRLKSASSALTNTSVDMPGRGFDLASSPTAPAAQCSA
jgi:hypothetical protein